jgi:hypothetical protein
MRAPKAKAKKRGRPATGVDPIVSFRSPPALTKRIDNWAKRQPEKVTRAEAIRRIVTAWLDREDGGKIKSDQ